MAEKLKVFTVGGYDDGGWIENSGRAYNIQDADIVIFPGGADIEPSIYGEKKSVYTGSYPALDARQINAYNIALKHDKFIVGICRGLIFDNSR